MPFFTGTPLPSIDFAMISRYQVDRRKAGAANATINRELAVRKGFFEHEQFEAVCRHLAPAVRAVVEFAYYTGWRKAEILGLEWNRVDLREGTVSLNPGETKNEEARTIYLTAALRELLERQNGERTALKSKGVICPWVFHRAGKPIKCYYTAWHTATRLAGCPGRIPHDFRRTAIRTFQRRVIPEGLAMKLSGHKTRSVFDRYNIVAPDDLKRAARILDEPAPKAGTANR